MKWLELGDMILCLDTNVIHVITQEHIMSATSRGYIGIPLFEGNQNRTWFFPSQEGTKWKRCSSA